ncbi:dethiobiotin synthase [Schlegelella sp. S2-27]|uniref:ATP-dependent dethiobiotin synthetase BioD n=1 Tax=Caldimonas mangrovi TaxID=2944811 RepID=A0ABT0YPS6_9BURK|nr:dethiobiotin synthase [Caldimonas mangrovi]
MKGVFVTGTDTEVGKTCVSAGLSTVLARAGMRVAGCKPVAAGLRPHGDGWVNDDVEALRAASTVQLSTAEVCPCLLREPCAPHIAAQREGLTVERAALLGHVRLLAERADALVVEGVGGFCVPLGQGWGTDDFAADLGMPVVLVVGLRLGCLNHALLTAQAVHRRGLLLAGWVANRIDPRMAHADENIATLDHLLAEQYAAPRLATVPWMAQPTAEAVADCFEAALLLQRLPGF